MNMLRDGGSLGWSGLGTNRNGIRFLSHLRLFSGWTLAAPLLPHTVSMPVALHGFINQSADLFFLMVQLPLSLQQLLLLPQGGLSCTPSLQQPPFTLCEVSRKREGGQN